MIHYLPTTTTHDALVNKIKPPILQIITHENPIPGDCSNEERDTLGCLNFRNTFPKKNNGRRTSQFMIKRADIKIPILCQLHLIRSPSSSKGKLAAKNQKKSSANSTSQSLISLFLALSKKSQ